jgi:hypothetical protein
VSERTHAVRKGHVRSASLSTTADIHTLLKVRFGPESDLSRCSKTLIVGFLPGFRSTKSGLLAACSAGYAALFAAATLAPTTRALNSSTVITSAVENASIVNVARWTSAADSAP